MQATATNTESSLPHVLIVDDDAEIAALLSRYLGGNQCRTSSVGSGAGLREFLPRNSVDLILLDLGLPDEDGLSLLRHVQGDWHIPVIVVSGRGESVERVVGLELGADDYVTKPFDLRELLARVRTVLRRTRRTPVQEASAQNAAWRFDGLCFDPSSRRLTDREGRDIPLTTGEFDLLQLLLDRPNQVLSRDQLMNHIHGREAGPFDRSIDVQVGRLRRKIEVNPANPRLIQSVRGAGYLLATRVMKG